MWRLRADCSASRSRDRARICAGARSNPRLYRDSLTYRIPWERSEPVSASGENKAFCFAGFWGLATARLREFRSDAMDNLFPLATANWKAGVRLPHRQYAANSALTH
jgi:hypothetical protein